MVFRQRTGIAETQIYDIRTLRYSLFTIFTFTIIALNLLHFHIYFFFVWRMQRIVCDIVRKNSIVVEKSKWNITIKKPFKEMNINHA